MVAAWPGHAAQVPQGGLVAPQGANVWLVASHPARIALAPLPASRPVTLTLAQGEIAGLPRQAGALTAWVAAAQGQPGFAPGPASGVSVGGAIAIVANDTASLRVADDADSLRVTANPVALTQAPIRALAGSLDATLPAASATELVLDPARRLLRLALPPGTAAVAGWPDRDSRTVWAGQAPASHTIEGRWRRLLLVNINQAPAAVSVAQDTLAEEDLLGPGHAFRRFFGAAGSLDLAVPAAAGQTLVVAGAASGVFTSQDGQGAARHAAAARRAGPPDAGTRHRLGGGVAGGARRHTLAAARAEPAGAAGQRRDCRATPCACRSARPGRRCCACAPPRRCCSGWRARRPALFPAGAVFSRYVPAGDTSLLVVPAQDGPLSGRLEASASPVLPAQDGLGDAVAAAPGDSVLFGFTLATPRRIGIGAQAEPDGVSLVLLDAAGHEMARGAAMLEDLPAGRYVLQAKVAAGRPRHADPSGHHRPVAQAGRPTPGHRAILPKTGRPDRPRTQAMKTEPKRWRKAAQGAKVFWSFFSKKDCLLAVLLVLASPALAAPDRQARADGTRIIPDHFLREWDPVTIFFPTDTGPAEGGPEDQPQRLVTLQPPTEGAWQWLGARVLQFRPAEPWQALRRVRVAVGTQATVLVPLLPVPVASGPADTGAGVVGLDRIALTFPGPVDTDALARLLTVELRPAPGIVAAGATLLTAQDFDLAPGERTARDGRQVVVVVLHRPVADGQVAIVRLRLSDVPRLDASRT